MNVYVEQGLQAHFFQPDGTSRPGTEWAVAIDDGATMSRVLVRAYADDVAGLTTAEEANAVIAFIESKLAAGWKPTDATEPLTLPKPMRAEPIVAPPRYWFPAKEFGWGWGFPSTWEGWAVTAIWLGVLIAGSILLLPQHGIAFTIACIASTAMLIGLCFAKGEPPAWR